MKNLGLLVRAFTCPQAWVCLVLVALASFYSQDGYARDNWCIENPAYPPCVGARGRCTLNQDYSEGGFVADTANVEKTTFGVSRNKAYIGRYAQVCNRARVDKGAQVLDHARVSDNAIIGKGVVLAGHAQVFGSAQVFSGARVFYNDGNAILEAASSISGNASIYGRAVIYGSATISGNASIYGSAVVSGGAEIYGNTHFSGNTRIVGGRYSGNDEGIVPAPVVERQSVAPTVSQLVGGLDQDKTKAEHKQHAQEKLKEDHNIYAASLPARLEVQNKIDELKRQIQEQELELGKLDLSLEACPLCLETLKSQENLVFTGCEHFICKPCYESTQGRMPACPICRNTDYRNNVVEMKYSE